MSSQVGVISDVRYINLGRGKVCEVKVNVDGRDTNWLPKCGVNGGALKLHIPPKVGDQVIVHNLSGKNEDGYVTDNIAYVKNPLPKSVNNNNVVLWVEDGTHIIFNLKSKKIDIKTPSKIYITAPSVNIKAKNVVVSALVVTIKALTTKIFSNVEIFGFLDINGKRVTHNGKNIGWSHTHGYEGDPQ